MNIWRLQTRHGDKRYADYCLEKHVAAVGWGLGEGNFDFESFSDYEIEAELRYPKKLGSVKRLALEVRPEDIIWIREKGNYYFARVEDNSHWQYVDDSEARRADAINQITNIHWLKVGTEADVPGRVATSFIRGTTFQRIRDAGIIEYCQLVYNRLSNNVVYSNEKIQLNQQNFHSLLTTDQCEDLLCFWLFSKFGYLCIPSTNKRSTPEYECVLIDPPNNKNIFIQVKKGKIDIDASEYENLDGVVWFLTTEGTVNNLKYYAGKMFQADPQTLYEFAVNEKNNISPFIKQWINLMSK